MKLLQNVTHYYGDRDVHLEFIKLLKYVSKKNGITKESGKKWDFVIDFCCYLRKEVKSVIRGLTGLLKLYVLISTDSVYDVCDEGVRTGLIKESDDIRPPTEAEIKKLAKDEDYGHDKLKCEEYLRSHITSFDQEFNYICLRLPDVIGPYDSTSRFWAYCLWVQNHQMWPVHTQSKSDTDKLSFVFSEDVSGFIHSLLPKIQDESFLRKIFGHSFNLSFKETPTLNELIRLIVIFF